ncbi:hypothetical protein CEXT_394481 [Caerostris extrusa]|uniref:Uncharacterized protein n=1 Tax=Caerostris extrusa TaxID=172846 RepID=A0AAV4T9V9_CAEEX|nr:hypothetical protein CEXT_394481 [Caerostris extrusa]
MQVQSFCQSEKSPVRQVYYFIHRRCSTYGNYLSRNRLKSKILFSGVREQRLVTHDIHVHLASSFTSKNSFRCRRADLNAGRFLSGSHLASNGEGKYNMLLISV